MKEIIENCLSENKLPEYAWIYHKGVKILTSDGEYIFAVIKKNSNKLSVVTSEELTKLVLEGGIE
jgi:hypothetical protein